MISYLDLSIIGAYLLLSMVVGFYVFRKASEGKVSYFLGGRNLPWWWAGISIAATTFAADTPLAITGIVARKGFAGNWIWLSWIIMHAATAVFFAKSWRRSEVLTDSQIISLRYTGKQSVYLRYFKSAFYAIIFNCLILGWVIKAMSKILAPFFMGTIFQNYEVFMLMFLVILYSSAGGLRGVLITDLLQLAIAIIGSYTLAYFALSEVGGFVALSDKLTEIYGVNHHFTNFVPLPESDGVQWSFYAAFVFILYLLTQAFASGPADGGGYLMQRLGACKDIEGAKKATLLFIFLQYVVRLWPWIIVALTALIIFPLGQESVVLDGAYSYLQNDRESAYPALMKILLPSGFLGLAIVGMLAAFMSTIDTHLNWGSSYVVNDFLLKIFPAATSKTQIRTARIATLCFAVAGMTMSYQIHNITQAWKWLSIFGACFSVPTLLRWFWWRVNATSEILALIFGLLAAGFLGWSDETSFQKQVVIVTGCSLLGTLVGVYFGTATDESTIEAFVKKIKPFGFWGKFQHLTHQNVLIGYNFIQYVLLVLIVLSTFFIGQSLINGRFERTAYYTCACILLIALAYVAKQKLNRKLEE